MYDQKLAVIVSGDLIACENSGCAPLIRENQ